jgi:hypothetical protein
MMPGVMVGMVATASSLTQFASIYPSAGSAAISRRTYSAIPVFGD